MRSVLSEYEFAEAPSLMQALTVLNSGEGWRPIAGGTDLMVLFNAGALPYKRLLSVRKLPELNGISVSPEFIRIGAAVTYSAIQRAEAIQQEFPLLCQAAGWTGSVANQNRGTLGGNIANGSPAADSAPALLVYDAGVELTSIRGTRRMPYRDFHIAYKKMNLEAGELLTAVHLPRTGRHEHQYARKVGSRRAQAISKVSFYAVADLDGKVVRHLRLALGSVAPYPLRCHQVEQILLNQLVTPALIEAARQTLAEEVKPIDDIRSTAVYRSQVSQNLLVEFLEQLL